MKDADRGIIDDLDARGLLVAEEPYDHSYPHCWRCGTPLIYWAKTSWFARTSDRRDELLRENETHRLAPRAHQARPLRQVAREQRRLGAVARPLLGHAPADLALRRLRPRHMRRLGRRARHARWSRSLRAGSASSRRRRDHDRLPGRCGGTAHRIEPVLDAWFDSGSMPSAQLHYPFEHQDEFEQRFPADFICEAIDQTRGWFYSLLAVNTLVFDSTPVPQRGVPRAHRRSRRAEDVEVARQRHRPVDHLRQPRRRRAALVLLLRRLTVDEPTRRRADDRRVDPTVPAHAVEHALLLLDLRRPRRLGPGDTGTAQTVPRPRPRPLDALASSTTRSPRSPTRSSRSTRSARRSRSSASSTTCRTGTCADRALGSGSRPTRPRTRRCTSAS